MKGFLRLFVLAAISVLSGCQSMDESVCVINLAQNTPRQCGNIKLYGSDSVPFEYEEIAAIGTYKTWADESEALEFFIKEAEKLKADAVINFRVQPGIGVGGLFLVITMPSKMHLTGTAVRIKRP